MIYYWIMFCLNFMPQFHNCLPNATYQSGLSEDIFLRTNGIRFKIYESYGYDSADIIEVNVILEGQIACDSSKNSVLFNNENIEINVISEDIVRVEYDHFGSRVNQLFYCISKRNAQGKLIFIGHGWNKGRRIGKWLFFNENGELKKVDYDSTSN